MLATLSILTFVVTGQAMHASVVAQYFAADFVPAIVVRKPVEHCWIAFAVPYRFPWIQLFLLLLSLVPVFELSHSSFLKILALRRLYLFSCRPYFSVIWRVSLKLFMAISRPSRASFLSSSAILFVYHVLLIIAIATEIQNILQQNIVLWWLFSTFAW